MSIDEATEKETLIERSQRNSYFLSFSEILWDDSGSKERNLQRVRSVHRTLYSYFITTCLISVAVDLQPMN